MEKQNKRILESADFSFVSQCPVCNSTKSIELGEVYRPAGYKIKDNTVVLSKDCISILKKCNSCGLIFLSLMTTTDTEKKLYSCWTTKADEFHRWKPANFKGLENIKSNIDRVTRTLYSEKNLTLLDIGIGEGDFVKLFNKDYKTFGLDKFVTPGVDYQSVVNEKMLFYDIEEDAPELEMRKFYVVTAFDIFEHFKHPQKAVRNICEMLIDGGLLVVETGNIDSFPGGVLIRNS